MSTYQLPARVILQEEGPREGFQSEALIPVDEKLRLIHGLAETGLEVINCASFVDVRRVPQMADAEEVAARICRRDGVRYTGIWLNGKGFERAMNSGLDLIPNVFTSVSDTFARNNTGRNKAELLQVQSGLIEHYKQAGMRLGAAHIFTAFGCPYEGKFNADQCLDAVDSLLRACEEHAETPSVVYLCDTVGAANPLSIKKTVNLVRDRWPTMEFALHLHDTRGMGLSNVLAGLECGIQRFDTSVAGLGGCPFAGNKAAAGNVCTEDVALMCEEMGISTGLDLDLLAQVARMAEEIVGHPLPGKFMKAGRIPSSSIHAAS
ncbi:hydroxymethylglutaryl-CoA lyase [Paraburkholderia sp. HD33-4]|uniref:hydroxymethylglutaryl-CoA lyase n=1 Tax=Paraburkholderia sp. HD33-4 TaxID=2883242 RepID=UPI001F15745E|nr:hydroxymethylglutaryl-CoA lyase [Paraburkholderia sp. HD33-4]